ncbi:undecaprenyl-diphosphate phosphatase [Litorivicinus lipolyticus]|uniref:Undecaprenyl-diphosphatase n=1 Tax=Litorivicinus lipolyticus TaxID=418701 RepID=A0A5Q2QH47_9GAMM|nr:undecaprenyl-diphosphate phosphatase [Litorivicinus lipolyticus]QGG80345.1 undecaprenyl-diphosphate phosphatase [Litorivicinus lipolyticus]
MELIQIITLALVQGLTEFLPISSSAHLVLVSPLLGWPDQGLTFDIAVHVGTLVAVVAFYRADLMRLARQMWRPGAAQTEVMLLAVATLPAVVAGLVLGDWLESWTRAPWVIATTTLVFALALGFADRKGRQRGVQVTLAIAVGIGLAQVLALVPGTSRSGVTMTAALLLGLSRSDAARFSFLMAIPIIAGAALLLTKEALDSGGAVNWSDLGLGALVSCLAAFACIRVFVGLIERIGMMVFVWYRVALSAALFAWILW